MRIALGMITLGLASSAFALDEYLPVAKGAIEVDAGYNFLNSTGGYDKDGEKVDLDSLLGPDASFKGHIIPVQVKYGIMPGLDVEVAWAFQLQSMSFSFPAPIGEKDTSFSGFGQPEIGLKYALIDIGAGAYVNFTLPFATGDFADPDAPPMALAFGAVYTKLFSPMFNLTAQAGYKLNFEAENKSQAGNVLSIYAKPEYRFNQFGGAYFGIKYEMSGETQLNGKGIKDSEGSLLTLLPGWNAMWLPTISTEINIPYTVMGKNSIPFGGGLGAYWGINAKVYYTFGM